MDSTETAVNLSFQLMFGIIGMILLTVFIIIFFIVYQRKLLQQQVYVQKIESDHQKKLLNSNILAQEEERNRLAIEFHDSVGGLLSATKIYVSNVSQELPQEQFQLFKEKALITLNQNIKEVRNITNNLLPQSLERFGVVTATRNLTEKLIDIKGIVVNFKSNKETRFDKNREKAVFRIMQELINNTLKHSDAKNLTIEFEFNQDQLKILFTEDGQGFNRSLESLNNHKSYGLKSIESRIAFLNGRIDYKTAPDQGVMVNIFINL